MGFGHSSHIHTAKILRLSQDLPIVIEIVDAEEKIDAFLPVLDGMMGSGLVTLEKVKVLQYGDGAVNAGRRRRGRQLRSRLGVERAEFASNPPATGRKRRRYSQCHVSADEQTRRSRGVGRLGGRLCSPAVRPAHDAEGRLIVLRTMPFGRHSPRTHRGAEVILRSA